MIKCKAFGRTLDGQINAVTFGETGAQETRNLLNQGFRCQKGIVLFGEFFDKLLVLVKSGEMKSELEDGA